MVKILTNLAKKAFLIGLSVFFINVHTFVLAESNQTSGDAQAGTTTLVGPTEPVGPTEKVGPTTLDMSNDLTGANSDNTNVDQVNNTTAINSTDTSKTSNNSDIAMNSGDNTLAENSDVGSLSTGNLDGTVNIINTGGNQTLAGGVGFETIDGQNSGNLSVAALANSFPKVFNLRTLSNTQTGDHSRDTNLVDSRNAVTFISNDQSEKNNNVVIDATTGNNLITENTRVGDIITGGINLGVNLINLKNLAKNSILGLNILTVLNGLDGDIVLPSSNNATGSNSTNSNSMDESSNISITSVDSSTKNNDFQFDTNTGRNKIESNTAVADVETGETNIAGTVANIVDAPVFYIINVFGKWLGTVLGGSNFIVNQIDGSTVSSADNGDQVSDSNNDLSLSNGLTGANSDNQNMVDSQNNVNITSTDQSQISNQISIRANTGDNEISKNTLLNNVSTGAINIIANTINVSSLIPAGIQNMRIQIINIFGNWSGNLTDRLDITKNATTTTKESPVIHNMISKNNVSQTNSGITNQTTKKLSLSTNSGTKSIIDNKSESLVSNTQAVNPASPMQNNTPSIPKETARKLLLLPVAALALFGARRIWRR